MQETQTIFQLLQQEHFLVINTYLLLLPTNHYPMISTFFFYMIQTFIQESGRFIEESCSKFDVIFLLSKSKIVTIITIPFNICNFSYNKSYHYHSKVLCFRTNCLPCKLFKHSSEPYLLYTIKYVQIKWTY